MEIFLILVITLLLLPLFPVIRGNDEFSGNGELNDMNIDQSLRKRFVHNALHPTHFETINDGLQAQYPPCVPEIVEPTIASLMISNKNVVDMLRSLEIRFDRFSDADRCTNSHDMTDIMHKLDIIYRYIISSDKSTNGIKCPCENGMSEMRLIEEWKDEIGVTNQRLRNVERNFDEAMTDIRKSIQSLEKISYTIQDIDYRTIRIYDVTNRQAPSYIVHSNPTLSTTIKSKNRFNIDDIVGSGNPLMSYKNSETEKKLNGNDVSVGTRNPMTPTTAKARLALERSYRNLRKNASEVSFEPNKLNCHELKIKRNGIYKFASQDEVANEAGRFFYERYCDFNTDAVAWTVIERRYAKNREVSFNRSWLEYKLGFGNLYDEFWFGNDFIHKLTAGGDMELRIVLEDTSGKQDWAEFSMFKVESEENNYKLMINMYRGSGGFDFLSLNGQPFSTYDQQNDKVSCPSLDGSGWWFKSCTEVNWLERNSLKASTMMVRPKNAKPSMAQMGYGASDFITILSLVYVSCVNGGAIPISEELAEEPRYTDWAGCMAICYTPTCGIANCYQWCVRVCCGQYWDSRC